MKRANNQTALAQELQKRIDANIKKRASNPWLELGTIQSNMSLKVDSLPGNINSYMVARHLTLEPTITTETDGEHSHPEEPTSGAHQHTITLPEQLYKLQAGDRVLVAWVGNVPVVVEVVVDRL